MQRRVEAEQQSGADAIGGEIHALAAEIFPVCRSITGDGVRETLGVLSRHVPLDIVEVPSGTEVFDWVVPPEWVIREAHITSPDGRRVVCMTRSNLHVMSYSTAVRSRMPLSALRGHIHTLPNQPDLIPYRTSYYAAEWGFCMSANALAALPEGDYDVVIDSEHRAGGSLTYGEYLHRGDTDDEVLLSAHICHPSLANDNCSGLALLTRLAAGLMGQRTRLSYRFLFAPGTIGAITWLARNEGRIAQVRHGLVVSCAGDAAPPSYKRSRRGNAEIDRAMAHILARTPGSHIAEFSPFGYDERQYCSPGFDLPVGSFQRSRHGTFPEYHTSADTIDFITPAALGSSYAILAEALSILERNGHYRNLKPKCEPQLGRRGLYASIGGHAQAADLTMAMLWVLNQSDGIHALLDIAERAALPFDMIAKAAELLAGHGLIAPVASPGA